MDLLRGKNPNPFTNYVKKDCYICLVTIVAGQIIVYTEAYEHTKIEITVSNSLSGSPATHRPNHGKRTAGRMEAPHYRRTLHGPFRSNARRYALRRDVGSGQRTPPVYRQRYRTSRYLLLGSNILQTPDRKYHLFVCGWPESAPKGHMEWPNSTVYHATGDHLHGPFTIQDTIGKGHNPEAFVLNDGRIVVYVIDGYYIADQVNGPWQYGKFTFNPRDRKIIEGLSNLSFAKRQDGSYLMVCRGGGIWISKDGIAPYEQITDKRVYPPVKGEFEDPIIWRDSLQYHLIVNDWLGRIAFYQRSKDGIHWVTEQGEAYVPGISFHRDGHVEHWFKYERPKVFQDKQGRVEQMNFAVIDTVKWDDHGNDNHSSKNICIPMNKGMLLSVLNRTPITASTETIRVKVLAEEGFDPLREIDVPSLRFGSYNEVNFGRGCKVVKTEASGKDLILTFDGKGSGITPDEFAPKMIGKDKNGKLLFGYANLPYVDYKPALLSCRRPVYREGRNEVELEVQNFGLSASGEMTVEIKQAGAGMGRHTVKPLQPYEKASLTFTPEKGKWTDKADYQVVFLRDGQIVETNNFNISK